MSRYPVENLLREPTEFYSAVTLISLALLAFILPHSLFLTQGMGQYAAIALGCFGVFRGLQGYRIRRYHKRLLAMPYFAMSTCDVPLSKKWLFVGRGFLWLPRHTQRLNQIKQVKNEAFMKRGYLHEKLSRYREAHERHLLARLLSKNSRFNPFRPPPEVGGKSYLHGVGDEDRPIYIPQAVRVGHTFVVGTTRVGKTRLASILINQDIRNGDAVIVVDPKGDLDLVRDMYSACNAAGRLDDFRVVHLGYPELSAQYNPLKNYDQISEVATRITDAIAAEGEGKQFAAFAWKYVNIVSICLEEMKKPITYKSIAFYINRLDQLLVAYADTVLPERIPDYIDAVAAIIAAHDSKVDKHGNPQLPMERSKAVANWLKGYISDSVAKGTVESLHDQVLIDLYDAAIMDQTYYAKITASVGPVLSEINKSNAANIFSFHESSSEIELLASIKDKKVIYIGLDSLTNPNIAQAVGKAFLSDLVSTAGKIYKDSHANYRLNLHCDELSEIIQQSFVKILNKAGGAGYQVTAYAQTKQDLEVALGSRAMAEVTKGNLNTLILLRVENEETANMLANVLPKVDVVNHTEVSMVSDTPHGEGGVFFNTTNEDRVQKSSIPMLEVNDITSLPKGQAFVLVNGGELYKVRIPLPINDGLAPNDVVSAMRELNFKNQPLPDELGAHVGIEKKPFEQVKDVDVSLSAINKIDEVLERQTLHHGTSSKGLEQGEDLPFSSVSQEDALIEDKPQEKHINEDNLALVSDFKSWLEKRINSNNRSYKPEGQKLVKTSKEFDNDVVFVTEEVIIKYQSRSGIEKDLLGTALKAVFEPQDYFVKEGDELQSLYPVKVSTPMDSATSSTIEVKGE